MFSHSEILKKMWQSQYQGLILNKLYPNCSLKMSCTFARRCVSDFFSVIIKTDTRFKIPFIGYEKVKSPLNVWLMNYART